MTRVSLLTLLVLGGACHEVSSTGAYGIRGRLKDHIGHDLEFVRVVSEEHGVTTEGDGRFAVRWKDPATFVDMKVGGITWRRRWLPESDSGEVEIRLPETREGTISCRTDTQCVAELEWEGEPGLTGRLDVECGDTAMVKLTGLPTSLPRVTCPTVLGDQELQVAWAGTRLEITGEPSPLPVGIAGASEDLQCDLAILDGTVQRTSGSIGLQPRGETFAWAVCDGRVGTPVLVRPRPRGVKEEDARVALPWAVGPDLRLPEPIPEPRGLTLVRRDNRGSIVWKVVVEPALDGMTYKLPPLPRGQYRVGLGSPALFANANPPTPEVPGQLYLLGEDGTWGEDGGMVGALRLEEDLGKGEITVHLQGDRPQAPDPGSPE